MANIIIAAVARNYVIGDRGQIPWFSDDSIRKPDMKRFRELTLNHPVIMGRKTFDSIGSPLKDRMNIVLTRNPEFYHQGVYSAKTIEEAILKANILSNKDVYIIGGAEVYKETLPLTDRLELTELHTDYNGDAFFPEYKNTGEWLRTKTQRKERFSFVSYEKII